MSDKPERRDPVALEIRDMLDVPMHVWQQLKTWLEQQGMRIPGSQIIGGVGTGGSITPPLELGPSTDEAALIITTHPGEDQETLPFQFYDQFGDLAVDIDSNGIFDCRAFNVQSPPDTGPLAPGGSGSQVFSTRWVINSGNDTADNPLTIRKWDGLGAYRDRILVKYSDSEMMEFQPIAGEVAITFAAPVTPTGNAIELWDHPFNNLLFAVTYTGGVIFPSADPLVAGAWWDNAGTLTRSTG